MLQFLLPLLVEEQQESNFVDFERNFHSIVAYSLPWAQISDPLTKEITKEAWIILGIDTLEEDKDNDRMEVDDRGYYSVRYSDWRNAGEEVRAGMMTEGEHVRVTVARDRLLSLLRDLQLVSLGGMEVQKIFASVMDRLMTVFIQTAYAGQWEGPTSVPQHLGQWVEDVFARLVVEVLAIVNVPHHAKQQQQQQLDVSLRDVAKWQEIAIARLGALRTTELFDVIVEWPASIGAIEDLRHFTTHPVGRSYLTHSFVAILNQRLLHPGSSTVEILRVYISIIRAFNVLDPKGVLLDRAARPIRRYLRERDDTVKAIVGGLLADDRAAAEKPTTTTRKKKNETLSELASELVNAHEQLHNNLNTGELDWDDMNWMPDPIDAAPDYRKSKTSDVVGGLISLFDSKEAFVREMQSLLAERLLRKKADFDQEVSVLELLKMRVGDSALQACEVMVRDILDSKRVDAVVRNDQKLISSSEEMMMPDLHAKILSRFFWPDIQGQEFKIPEEMAQLQQRYAAGFESLKQSRKLTWLNWLGQVTVELELTDRVFVDEVTTWQASVIHAFQSSSSETAGWMVGQLAEKLHMAVFLVRSACLFWVSKRILTEVSRDNFRVLEEIPPESPHDNVSHVTLLPTAKAESTEDAAARAAAAAAAAEAAAAKESADAAAMEKMNLYWQFIVGMLTNQGAMPLQRIAMMLKLVVPGGFPYSNEELREFLAGMVSKGRLEVGSGGTYRIIR